MSFTDDLTFQQGIKEIMPIAETAELQYQLHNGRSLFGFKANPHMFVVAQHDVGTHGLAILLVEQLAITHAQSSALQAGLAIVRLQDLPPPTEQLQ